MAVFRDLRTDPGRTVYPLLPERHVVRSRSSSPARRGSRVLPILFGGILVLGGAYVWIETVRTGHPYHGSPQEIVEAMLHDIRADVAAQDWASLGSYGVGTFLSWKNEEKLREYVQEELDNGAPGPVDYVLQGVPDDITSTGGEIRFTLLEPQSETTCRVVLERRWGYWHVKDISQMGTPRS